MISQAELLEVGELHLQLQIKLQNLARRLRSGVSVAPGDWVIDDYARGTVLESWPVPEIDECAGFHGMYVRRCYRPEGPGLSAVLSDAA
jgi:hypothetical protein